MLGIRRLLVSACILLAGSALGQGAARGVEDQTGKRETTEPQTATSSKAEARTLTTDTDPQSVAARKAEETQDSAPALNSQQYTPPGAGQGSKAELPGKTERKPEETRGTGGSVKPQ